MSHPFARKKAKGWGTGLLLVGQCGRVQFVLEQIPEGLVVDRVVELHFGAFDD